jgi:hypothetical protein
MNFENITKEFMRTFDACVQEVQPDDEAWDAIINARELFALGMLSVVADNGGEAWEKSMFMTSGTLIQAVIRDDRLRPCLDAFIAWARDMERLRRVRTGN